MFDSGEVHVSFYFAVDLLCTVCQHTAHHSNSYTASLLCPLIALGHHLICKLAKAMLMVRIT